MEIYIDNRQDKFDLDNSIEDLLEDVIRESLLVEGIGLDYEISVSFVDNEEIRQLNRDYRNIDKETDVLSFPMEEDFMIPMPLLGDIIISVEKAAEQAEDFGHSLEREITYLTAHSMFHLMGYDHMEEDEKRIMRDKEKQVMKRIEMFKDNKGE